MRSLSVSVILSLLIFAAPVFSDGQFVQVRDSPVTCSTEGVECQFSEDNLIDAVMHVMSLVECRQMCLDQESCNFISYFDATAAPIAHFCQLFSSCDTTTSCSSCVSENMACYRSCSENIVGVLDDNVLDVVPNTD